MHVQFSPGIVLWDYRLLRRRDVTKTDAVPRAGSQGNDNNEV